MLGAATAAPLLVDLLPLPKVPPIVSEIVAGILIGPVVLDIVDYTAPLAVFSSIGLVFPSQFALIRRTLGLERRLVLQFIAINAISGGVAALLCFLIPEPGPVLLVALAAGFSLVMLPALAALMLTRSERELLVERAFSVAGRRGRGQ